MRRIFLLALILPLVGVQAEEYFSAERPLLEKFGEVFTLPSQAQPVAAVSGIFTLPEPTLACYGSNGSGYVVVEGTIWAVGETKIRAGSSIKLVALERTTRTQASRAIFQEGDSTREITFGMDPHHAPQPVIVAEGWLAGKGVLFAPMVPVEDGQSVRISIRGVNFGATTRVLPSGLAYAASSDLTQAAGVGKRPASGRVLVRLLSGESSVVPVEALDGEVPLRLAGAAVLDAEGRVIGVFGGNPLALQEVSEVVASTVDSTTATAVVSVVY